MNANKEGRPPKTGEELNIIFRKLEPFLKSGLSLYKACQQAQIPKSTVYDYYGKNTEFSEKIDTAIVYPSSLINNLFFCRLAEIATKQNKIQELSNDLRSGKVRKDEFEKLKVTYEVTREDWKFLYWYAVHSYSTRDDYGRKIKITKHETQPLAFETSTKRVADLLRALLH